MSTGEPPSAPGQPGPEEIERQLRKIQEELAQAAKFHEPSAAERARKPRKAGLGRVWSLVIAVVVIAGLAGAAVEIPKLVLRKAPGNTAGRQARNSPTPTAGRAASSAPATSLPSPTVAAPFLGTPAQPYADGAAGIVIPPVTGVGSYSAAQVAAAYRTTRKLLIAANLNGPALDGGTPATFASLLIPEQRSDFLDHLDDTGVTAKGALRTTRDWVISFVPGTARRECDQGSRHHAGLDP